MREHIWLNRHLLRDLSKKVRYRWNGNSGNFRLRENSVHIFTVDCGSIVKILTRKLKLVKESLRGDKHMFSSSGIRGDISKLTPEYCVKLAQTFGTLTDGENMVIGWDGRISSPMIAKAIVSGLLSVGKRVDEIGEVPMPALSLLVEKRYDGG